MMESLRMALTAWLIAAGFEEKHITTSREGRIEVNVAKPVAVLYPEQETITRDGSLAAKSRDPSSREVVLRRRDFNRTVHAIVAIIADGRDQADARMEVFLLQAKSGFSANNNHVRLTDTRVEWIEPESIPDTKAIVEITLTFAGGVFSDTAPAKYATQAVVDLDMSGFMH